MEKPLVDEQFLFTKKGDDVGRRLAIREASNSMLVHALQTPQAKSLYQALFIAPHNL